MGAQRKQEPVYSVCTNCEKKFQKITDKYLPSSSKGKACLWRLIKTSILKYADFNGSKVGEQTTNRYSFTPTRVRVLRATLITENIIERACGNSNHIHLSQCDDLHGKIISLS
jgi:hypothetical protein